MIISEIRIIDIIISLVLILFILLSSGVGGIAGYQAGDWTRSNAVLSDLFNHSWPVSYDIKLDTNSYSILNYYIAYYLPSAFIGKNI